MPTARTRGLIQSNLQLGHVFTIFHTWTTVWPASLFVMSIVISSTVKLIYGQHIVARRSIDQRTGVSSSTRAALLLPGISGTLRRQPSATSLCLTLYSEDWTRCPARWALTLGNPAKCVRIIWPIQTTFATMITYIAFTAILLNALSAPCNSLRSGNMCHMLPRRNSMMLRNVSTQGWNQSTSSGLNMFVSWISS